GQMCDMRRIHAIAGRHNLRVIEDAAHAVEASREGIRVGELSDSACFSFYATKNITSGEGGAVGTDSEALAEALRMLRLHGIDRGAADRYTRRFQHYDMPLLGWKYNMDNIHAALLIGQLERIENLWQRRNLLCSLYEEGLREIRGIEVSRTLPGSRHARHLFTILVDPEKRDSLLWSLQDRGIGVAVNYRPIHLLRYYRETFGYRAGDYPMAEQIGSRTLSLPLYPSLKEEEVRYVLQTLKEAYSA
ncbi:MAG TPA: DegT/DnrJ/EryC1/StrS family aminotransferase, partial [Thermodesulfovibrionales bacterium]|nr:DegT/DnrJ/EryC1/StrS family aminotransferase [Thermodesulfovibrionales bacterium]